MKKILSYALVMVVISTLLLGCSAKSDTPTTDVVSAVKKNDTLAASVPEKFKTAGKILIGVDDQYPPMEYRDDKNVLVGFDVDFGNAIGKKLGIKIEWVATAWDGILPALKSSKFDMILSSLSVTDERKKEIGFSEPYIMGGPIIVTKKGNTTIKGEADLKGKVIGVQLGSTGEEAAKAISGVKEVKGYNKITEALMDLKAGRVEAVVADDQVGKYYIALDPKTYAEANKMAEEPFGIGFRQADKELTAVVQKAINELKSEGTLNKISQKWFKTDSLK